MKFFATLICVLLLTNSALAQWQVKTPTEKVSYRSIATNYKGFVCIGGSNNTIALSYDSGKTWSFRSVGLPQRLDFRGLAMVGDSTIVAVSAGLGEQGAAKIYRSQDIGKSWNLVYENNDTGVFMDGLKFFNSTEGIVYGDPLKSKWFRLFSKDSGKTWHSIDTSIPNTKEGEASFAASNSNIAVTNSSVYIASQSRVFFTESVEQPWSVFSTPFEQGATSGIFAMHIADEDLITVGGDYVADKEDYMNLAYKRKGKWKTYTCKPQGLKEAILPLSKEEYLILGTTGTSHFSLESNTCSKVDSLSFHTGICDSKYCYAAGAYGSIGVWEK